MKRLFYHLILAAHHKIPLLYRAKFFSVSLLMIAPFAYLLDLVNWWFQENRQFGQFICIALCVNMIVGIVKHLKENTFDWKLFFFRNCMMGFVIVMVYTMLEMLRYTAGDNLAGEIFKVLIQITTLMYPASKVLKNCFLLSGGTFPPEFMMNKLYNFEKNGDLNEFFKTKKEE